MTWRDLLPEDQLRRLQQIEQFEDKFSYSIDSDQYLIYDLARWFDIKEADYEKFRDDYTPWRMKIIQQQSRHAYTCRLLKRVDFIVLWLTLKRPYWKNGRLFIRRYEAPTIFPMSWYRWASNLQNKHYWTRIFLNI